MLKAFAPFPLVLSINIIIFLRFKSFEKYFHPFTSLLSSFLSEHFYFFVGGRRERPRVFFSLEFKLNYKMIFTWLATFFFAFFFSSYWVHSKIICKVSHMCYSKRENENEKEKKKKVLLVFKQNDDGLH